MSSYSVEKPTRDAAGRRRAVTVGRLVLDSDGTGVLVLRSPKLELKVVPDDDEPTRPAAETLRVRVRRW